MLTPARGDEELTNRFPLGEQFLTLVQKEITLMFIHTDALWDAALQC